MEREKSLLSAAFSIFSLISADNRKFRTLWQNWLPKHANIIMCNLFFKRIIGYWSKPEQTSNFELSVTISSMTPFLPISLWPCCVHLFQTALFFCRSMIFHIPNVKTYTLSLALFFFFFCFYCAPKQSNSHPSDIRHHQSFHAFRTALKTCLYKQKQCMYIYMSDFKFCLLSFEWRLSTVAESVIVSNTTCCLSNMSSAGYYPAADQSYHWEEEGKKLSLKRTIIVWSNAAECYNL